MLAAYVAVLWRWCRQNDFVVPFFVAGRQSEYRRTVGNFSHPIYMRLALSGDETFEALLEQTSNEFYRALTHQDFGRMAARHPGLLSGTLFQWITWHPDDDVGPPIMTESGAGVLAAERIAVRDFGGGLTAVPAGEVAVEVTFFDTAQGIYAAGVYRADRFKQESMTRFLDDVRCATEEFVRHPGAPLATRRDGPLTLCTSGVA